MYLELSKATTSPKSYKLLSLEEVEAGCEIYYSASYTMICNVICFELNTQSLYAYVVLEVLS